MERQELINLGFVDTSWETESNTFTEYSLVRNGYKIEVSGKNLVEIILPNHCYIEVPGCKTIDDIKLLIKLFTP